MHSLSGFNKTALAGTNSMPLVVAVPGKDIITGREINARLKAATNATARVLLALDLREARNRGPDHRAGSDACESLDLLYGHRLRRFRRRARGS